ncbi:hypothetical protein JIQ42_03190 [Leishmania sp. Namibia]|uniref:hypothetical protein n=1 Tax=Leishmania sp. Namibia TaxID=2802991 RepID=UPI001B4E8A49|nr:hypothetical protein JIQ42_03190 [Leishmania sp. Namibia]
MKPPSHHSVCSFDCRLVKHIGVCALTCTPPNFIVAPLFVRCGLAFPGATDFCGVAMLLQKLPHNR